jgi:hypothetical protein
MTSASDLEQLFETIKEDMLELGLMDATWTKAVHRETGQGGASDFDRVARVTMTTHLIVQSNLLYAIYRELRESRINASS